MLRRRLHAVLPGPAAPPIVSRSAVRWDSSSSGGLGQAGVSSTIAGAGGLGGAAGGLRATERPHGSRTLRFLGYSVALTAGFVGAALMSWPLLDAKILPYVHRLALRRAAVRREDLPREETFVNSLGVFGPTPAVEHALPASRLTADQATAVRRLHSLLAPDAGAAELVVLTGPAGCGKTTVLSALSSRLPEGDNTDAAIALREQQPVVYISCRNFTEPATFLFGLLTHLFTARLGLVGDVVIAYHKLYNGIVDLLTMNQQHNHVSFILLCQALGHMRHALHDFRNTTKGGLKPILVFDHAEQLIENDTEFGKKSDISLVGHCVVNLILRTCHDEQLAHVVVAFESECLMPPQRGAPATDGEPAGSDSAAPSSPVLRASQTRLGASFPALLKHASLRSVPARISEAPESPGCRHAVRDDDCEAACDALRGALRSAGAPQLLVGALAYDLLPPDATRKHRGTAARRGAEQIGRHAVGSCGGSALWPRVAPVSAGWQPDCDPCDVGVAAWRLVDAGLATPALGRDLAHDVRASRPDTFAMRRMDQPLSFEASPLLRALSHDFVLDATELHVRVLRTAGMPTPTYPLSSRPARWMPIPLRVVLEGPAAVGWYLARSGGGWGMWLAAQVDAEDGTVLDTTAAWMGLRSGRRITHSI